LSKDDPPWWKYQWREVVAGHMEKKVEWHPAPQELSNRPSYAVRMSGH